MPTLYDDTHISLSEVNQSVDVNKQSFWKKLFSFIGPAYLVSVGYMDPGNWATDLAGGSKYGYSLIWVLLMSNIMALQLQSLSARLGIVRGRDLAQANRESYPKWVNFILYVLAEIAIAACDLAEVLGMAIGIQLLTGLPLIWGVAITILDTFLLLYLQKLGMRKMEAFIVALIAVIFGCFFIELFLAKPKIGDVVQGFVPGFKDSGALYIAIGIIGATVMPHNLYLHSALVQSRRIEKSDAGIKQAIKYNNLDTIIALNLAFLVNAAILVLAATVFHNTGNQHVAEIKEAHQLLPGFLGKAAPILFAIALIAAGQSSTVTGTLAGQIIMEGYLRLRINPWMRRLLTRLIAIVPAVFVILYFGESKVDTMLVLSQVVLSMQLGFAIIPLIHFVSDKHTMGKFAISLGAKIFAWVIATVLVYLNINMLRTEINNAWNDFGMLAKIAIIIAAIGFGILLVYITLMPIFRSKRKQHTITMHNAPSEIVPIEAPVYKRIAITVDFSGEDNKVIGFALGQGNMDTTYYLVHIVESAAAKLRGKDSDDYETREDTERLQQYVQQLKEKGYNAVPVIGFRSRVTEIVRIVSDANADLLVIGAHGHKGIRDYIYGQTVDAVRHQLKIPVLIVNL